MFPSHDPLGQGIRARHDFPNGYGVSVVRFMIGSFGGSYGAEKGLYYIGIMHNGSLTYDTPITDDLLCHQTEQDVTNVLAQVEALPKEIAR